jgi:SynChlorMet cassette radical SAM/SPASM protein ScmF
MALCDLLEHPETVSKPTDLPEGVPPLRSFYLYLSNGCNLACRHCWITPRFVNGQPSPRDVIDVDALLAAVDEAKPMGLISAKLTGGEPLLHPRFLEIVDLLTGKGLRLSMETNGTLLTPEIAWHLKTKTNLNFISVSVDGADAAAHDAFRGVPGAFDAVLSGLDNLVSVGYKNVQVIMSVHRGNRHQVDAVALLAAGHGAGSVKLNPVTNTGRGVAMHARGEGLDFQGRMALADDVFDGMRARVSLPVYLPMPLALTPLPQIQRQKGRTGDCGVRQILGFLGNGEIALCGIGRAVPELVYGRLGKDSIREIWLSHPTILALRKQLSDIRSFSGICLECALAAQCRTGCVAQNYVQHGKLCWPSELCAEAADQGIFPATRLVKRNTTTFHNPARIGAGIPPSSNDSNGATQAEKGLRT